MNSRLATGKSRSHNAGKKIIVIMQAYDRSNTWPLNLLEPLQRPVYLSSYNDPDVLGILMFNYNRTPGGTKDYPTLEQAHREIGSVMNISPVMYIDTPTNNADEHQAG